MLKAILIAAASLVSYDAVAWHSAMRHKLVGETVQAVSSLAALDWTWEE